MSDKKIKTNKKWSKKRRILTVNFIYEVYKKILFLIIILDVIAHQSILDMCCVNYASLGMQYLLVMRVILNQCICPTSSQWGNLIVKFMVIILT